MNRKPFALLSSLILAALVLGACAQATPAPTAAPVEPVVTQAPAEPVITDAPMDRMLPAVDPTELSGAIVTAGSSTIYPLAEDVYHDLVQIMLQDPSTIDRASYLMWAAHNLERMADRVTNICERTIYIVTGELKELQQTDDETLWRRP